MPRHWDREGAAAAHRPIPGGYGRQAREDVLPLCESERKPVCRVGSGEGKLEGEKGRALNWRINSQLLSRAPQQPARRTGFGAVTV